MSSPAIQQNGAEIRRLRKKALLNRDELARRAGLAHGASLTNIENERKPASLGALRRIAAALDVPLTWIARPGSDLHAVLTGSSDGESAA